MKIDIKGIKKVKKYREQGLSYREIARVMNVDVRQVYRWRTYGKEIDKYSAILKHF